MKRKVTVTSALDRGMGTVGKAINRSLNRMGVESDEDVTLYESIDPNLFPYIAKQFGEKTVFDYIKSMESKRIMNNKWRPLQRR